ncbi:hypothetical protein [Stutzerimonas stutzeri]|uniref:hypothetical protein n=1 Tax=Stutzerimonas stutzeri TaxID=316 RepID=UPI001C2DF5CB|nr:hypothetical protein [Stutzerimonas stutzeri]
MKKIALALICVVSSGAASAVEFEASKKLLMADCPKLLNEDVQINLSNNVVGGAACGTNALALATCSIGGRTSTRTVEKFDCTEDADGNETCNSFDPKQYEPAPAGATMATASTAQGTVIPAYPGVDCSATAAQTAATKRVGS